MEITPMHRFPRRGARLLACLMAALLVGCATAPGPRAGYPGIPAAAAIAVNQPQGLEGFVFESLDASPEPEVGTRLRYRSQTFHDLRIDAFAYMVGFAEDPDLVLADFDEHFDAYMQHAVAAGHYGNYRHQDSGRLQIEYPFGDRDGSWQLFHVDLGADGQPLTSVTHLHYRAPFGVKIRASHPRSISDHELRETVADFARQLLPKLEIRRNQGCPRELQVLVDPDAGGGPEALVDAIGLAMLRSGMAGCHDYDVSRKIVDAARERALLEAEQEMQP